MAFLWVFIVSIEYWLVCYRSKVFASFFEEFTSDTPQKYTMFTL